MTAIAKRLLLVATALLLLVTAAVAVPGVAAEGGSGASPERVASVGTNATAAFGVFRRPRQGSDRLPAAFTSWLASPDADPGLEDLDAGASRLGLSNTNVRLFLIPRGREDVCLLAWYRSGGSNVSCAPVDTASDPATPLLALGEERVYGIVPDGVTLQAAASAPAVERGENVIARDAGTADALPARPEPAR